MNPRHAYALTGLAALALGLSACGGPPCRSQSECPVGYYCVLNVSASGGADGECVQDCLSAEDCPEPESAASRAICTNEGRCRVEARPPRLRVIEPEEDAIYEEGTRTIRVSGEVETAAETVSVEVRASSDMGCFGGPPRSVSVTNPTPGAFNTIPFVVDRVVLDPGVSMISVLAGVQGSRQISRVAVEVPCPGCAALRVQQPAPNASAPGLELPELRGTVSPPVDRAVWRVHSSFGDVFDGTLPVGGNGGFSLSRVPLFAGRNRVEVVVSGVGDGLGEARCSTVVGSSVAQESGLRVVMSWDGGSSDLDLHLVGPGGRFGDPMTSLTARSPAPMFGGSVMDDFDGFGPEVLTLDDMPDGVYGLIVEPVNDAGDPGANTFLRVLHDGRPLTSAPVGPRHLSSDLGELWVAGTVTVTDGAASWSPVNETVPGTLPPTLPPLDWPQFY